MFPDQFMPVYKQLLKHNTCGIAYLFIWNNFLFLCSQVLRMRLQEERGLCCSLAHTGI